MGHSQGTTQMFVSMMAYPEFYKKHMKIFIALCPVVYLDHMNIELADAFKGSKMAQKKLIELGPEIQQDIPMNFLVSNIFSVSDTS